MGGICGWIGSPLEPGHAEPMLADMLARAEGDDVAGDRRVLVGSSALAARPGVVPVSTHRSGALLVAVEGRIHWHSPELAALAAQRDCAAALAQAFRRHGSECLQHIGGAFAIAIIDSDSASGLLAVDRMGIRTLCYANPSGRLVFGSSAESVAAHPEVGSALSHQAIFNYLFCHVVPAPGTVFAAVHKLRAGECVAFKGGAVDRRFYWQLRYEDEATDSFDALQPRFRQLLREATSRAIDGDTDVGAFLSGGTDSSTVTGLLTQLRGKPVNTYSIGFAADGFDEMAYARITARHFAARAHEYYVTPQDVVDAIPVIARAYDEPFGNESAVPTYFCARLARADGIRVMLAGDGGDEVFGGKARYAKQKLFEAYGIVPGPLRRGLIEPLALGVPGGDRFAPLRKLRSYIRQARVPLPDRLESYNFLQRLPLAEIFEPDFLAAVDPSEPLSLQREIYGGALSRSPVNRMMHMDLQFTLADNDLRKVSRMCEVAGVEVRYPLIDDALVDFSGEIPPSLKVKGLKLRYFFKQALKDFLPPETLAKSKHGFGMPFGLWLRDYRPLADLAHESLDAFAQRGIVKQDYVKQLLSQHETGHATYFGVMIWVIMMLERWLAARKM
jgi:asparagine synthase (glutamine-hydrolysing)